VAAAAIGSRAVKSPVARRQVASSLSSFVKALLDRGSGNFKGLPRPQVDKRASAKLSCRPTAVAPSGDRPSDLKFMIGPVRQLEKTLSCLR